MPPVVMRLADRGRRSRAIRLAATARQFRAEGIVTHHEIDHGAVVRTGDIELAQRARLGRSQRALRLRAPSVVQGRIGHEGTRIATVSTWCVIGKRSKARTEATARPRSCAALRSRPRAAGSHAT